MLSLGVTGGPGWEATHLRLEAHVKHAVGLVEHDVSDAVQVDDSARVGREELDHASGRADDELGAALHVGDVVL